MTVLDKKLSEYLPVSLNKFTVVFDQQTRKTTALDEINLQISAKGITAVIGGNGSGKTVLLKCFADLIQPQCGSLTWQRKPLPPRITWVPQQPVLLDRSVIDNIRLPLLRNKSSKKDSDVKKRCEEALDWAQISELSAIATHSLSTGQQQLVALARAWALEPKILLLDEPCANLDPSRYQLFNTLIQELSKSCKVIMSTHSIKQVIELAEDIILLDSGKLLAHLETHTFLDSPYFEAYSDKD